MITAIQLWFYFSFIAAALLSVLATHYYLKGKQHNYDNSLIWLASGLAIWLVVMLLESKMLPLRADLCALISKGEAGSPDYRLTEQKLGFPSIFRRIFSILNSVCLVLFLSYFQEGWRWLNSRIKKLAATPEKAALGVIVICTLAAVAGEDTWLKVETAMSILVSVLLTIGFFLSFRYRKIWWMLPLALSGGILLVANQFAILSQEHDICAPSESLIFRRILALFILMLNVGALALTWLGKNIESAPSVSTIGTNPAASSSGPESDPANSLEIREENGHVMVYLTFTKSGKTIERLSFDDKELTPAKRKFLVNFIKAAKTDASVTSRKGFANFSKERDEFIQVLNRKTEPLGIQLSSDDLIAPDKKPAEYRLTIRSENILIDRQAESLM